MQPTEILQLGIALVVIAAIVLLLRRAAANNRARGPSTARERLGVEEAIKPERVRRRPRKQYGKPGQPEATEALEEEEEEEEAEEADHPEVVADAEATAAYKTGLAKTRGGFVSKLGKLFGKKKIDAATVDELEEVLFTADIGPRAADRIFQSVKKGLSKNDLEDADKIWKQIRKTSREILAVEAPTFDLSKHSPFVLLVLGVNGVGKTTTIGKLADKWSKDGKKVILAAGDTFRAAATEQLEEWGKRANVPVVKGKQNGDPSSVIFDAVKRGVDEKFDIVICDTAGRLHSNAGLMDELKKVRRVCEKAMPGSPHEVWMVLDATTGQNAISQAKTFKSDMEITGIVLTKLDGSAKGGVVLGIADELKVPVRFVGVGEKIGDLRPFDPAAFVEALYADSGESAA
ncbi:MAG: signal recognition particle-docking protein FtsY [Deltaproteobacteria bacterium]|nr:signal recognition particle-docking protein FtsY [Deltaproteobacteria bacterium]